jgi:uroporphyrinogen III methyltransferase/synthase
MTVVGSLGDIVEKVERAQLKPPAITIVGDVVRLREELNWFEFRPLFGRRILVTRAREQASDFKAMLADLGADCIEFPTIGIAPPPSWEPLDTALSNLSSYDWAIFTSVNGVRFFMERLRAAGLDCRELKGVRIAAIGPKTAEALGWCGLLPDLVPEEYRAEAILEGLAGSGVEGRSFLMPRAMVARDVLPDTLRERGARVDVVPAYQTVLPAGRADAILDLLSRGEIDCLTFTSSSTVSNFFSLFKKEEILPHLEKTAIACIGPITAETAAKFGLRADIMPVDYTIPGLTGAICTFYEKKIGDAH